MILFPACFLVSACVLPWRFCPSRPDFFLLSLIVAGIMLFRGQFSVSSLLCFGIFCLLLCLLGRLPRPEGGRVGKIAAAAGKAAAVGLMVCLCVNTQTEEDAPLSGIFVSFALLAVLLLCSGAVRRRLSPRLAAAITGALVAVTPFFCFYIIETMGNVALKDLTWNRVWQNLALLWALFALLLAVLPSKKLAIAVFWLGSAVFGAANHYLTLFRGAPLMPSDLNSLATAVHVVGNYEFVVTREILLGCVLCFAALTLLLILPKTPPTRRFLPLRAAAGILAACFCLNFLCDTEITEKYDVHIDKWQTGSSYKTLGSTLGYTVLQRERKYEPPENYETKRAGELLSAYPPESDSGAVFPTIIAVMDESLSDLRALGDFETSEGYLDNWYSRGDYLYSGNLYVSAYAGHTANTEFEFLTGNSLYFMSEDVVAYQDYSMKNVGNLADILNGQGYLTTAIHPEYKGNWGRLKTYANFGFSDFLGIDDFSPASGEDLIRESGVHQNKLAGGGYETLNGYVSDKSSFDKIIQVYEENQGAPQFIFNVTMQNHGGWNPANLGSLQPIQLKKEEWQKYTDVSTYLTLIRETDRAVAELISYFERVDEPVLLCVFGDHQPGVNQEWRETLLGKPEAELTLEEGQKRQIVPYFIWANYDTGIAPEKLDLSANYLGALLLKTAGIPGAAYTRFLGDLQRQIPIINQLGYMDLGGVWHSAEEDSPPSPWLEDYAVIQYNALFDQGRDMRFYKS